MPPLPEADFLLFLHGFTGLGVGLILGSFLTMLTYRLPRRQSIIIPRSFCPSCQHILAPRDLIPVVSYLLHHAKCRFCDAAIAPRYMLIELITGLATTLLLLVCGFSWMAVLAVTVMLAAIALVVLALEARANG